MARHPSLSERLSKTVKVFFNGASRRNTRSRGTRLGHPPAAQHKAASTKTPPKKPTRIADKSAQVNQNKAVRNGSFWSSLFWVRPWLLVIALWLTFVLMIVIALAGLSNPGREIVLDPVDSAIVGQPLSTPDTAAVSRLIPRDETRLPRRDPAATLPPVEAERAMPVWPLLVMVVACAGGCMLMSNQGLLAPESRRGRRRVVVSQTGLRPVANSRPGRSLSKRQQRRSKQRRLAAQRPASQVMTFRPGQRLRNTSPQSRPIESKSVSFAVSSHDQTPTSVTVVPDNESSSLDWKEGSLAHRLDVRQTRSIRSFL